MTIIKIQDQDSRSEWLIKTKKMVYGIDVPNLLKVNVENLVDLPENFKKRDSETGEIATINGDMEYYSYREYDMVMLVYKFKELVKVSAVLGYYEFEMGQFEREEVTIHEFDKVLLRRKN